ncbi:MAG: sigma-70 family RNA polymerase sigma factor [Verrucomicrobiaceae bacterium]|nr:MAG: sigma-70 family RNA polymerase sigma factor [Verrucomicrobiaceae bacterium]
MLYSFDAPARLIETSCTLTDEQLMEAVQQEDPHGLEELHRRHSATLKAVIVRVLHNEHSAEDLLQEVFLEVWRLANRYSQEKGKALGWMITLARRRAIDRLRREQAYFRVEERFQKETEQQPEAWTHSRVEDDIEAADLRNILAEILETLPPAQKHAVELAFYKGMSQREIASHTNIPLGTIKTRLELGVRKIAARLRDVVGDVPLSAICVN